MCASNSLASSVLSEQSQRHGHQAPGTGVVRVACGHSAAHRKRLFVLSKSKQRHIPHDRRIHCEERIERTKSLCLRQRLQATFRLTAARKGIAEPGVDRVQNLDLSQRISKDASRPLRIVAAARSQVRAQDAPNAPGHRESTPLHPHRVPSPSIRRLACANSRLNMLA